MDINEELKEIRSIIDQLTKALDRIQSKIDTDTDPCKCDPCKCDPCKCTDTNKSCPLRF